MSEEFIPSTYETREVPRVAFAGLNKLTGWKKADLDKCADSVKTATKEDLAPGTRMPSLEDANLVSSLTTNGTHMPVLDIDYQATLHPSTTEGHYHLFLDVELEWEDYLEVLHVLSKHGIIQRGFYEAAKHRGMSMVRKPGVYKQQPPRQVQL